MATRTVDGDWGETRSVREGARYTRVAMWLHWAIAALIVWNLVSGLLVWDLARDFFQAYHALYAFGITSHLSSGLTVLALSVVRIGWRLSHEPPPYPADMKPQERHAAHFAHFLLYTGMILMPLLGWAILSAHPPAGSPGSKVARPPMAGSPMAGSSMAGPPAGMKGPPPPPGIWWLVPLPTIAPIAEIGREPGGVEPQHILHEEFAQWHRIGGYLMLVLLALHIGGALKHQLVDGEAELQRMGVRRRRSVPRRAPPASPSGGAGRIGDGGALAELPDALRAHRTSEH